MYYCSYLQENEEPIEQYDVSICNVDKDIFAGSVDT